MRMGQFGSVVFTTKRKHLSAQLASWRLPSRPSFLACTATFILYDFINSNEGTSKPALPNTIINQLLDKMHPRGNAFLKRWHRMLGLRQQSPPSWYRDRLREELVERRTASTPWQKLSETSDVFFSISRAQYDGFPVRKLPPFVASRHVLVYAYMLVKYTLRWKFYQIAASLCKIPPHYKLVREVVNPSKDRKLHEVASRHQIDPAEFERVGRQLRRVWPLLP